MKKTFRRQKTLEILEALSDTALATFDLFKVLFLSGGVVYRSRIEYDLRILERERERAKIYREHRQKLYSLIHKLKKEGVLESSQSKWQITRKGKALLYKLKEKLIYSKNYKKENANQRRIIIFDIPEKIRFKREWLRSVLENLGFKMCQKSVWIGSSKLPQEFINDLDRLNILSYIEIFIVTKEGTLDN